MSSRIAFAVVLALALVALAAWCGFATRVEVEVPSPTAIEPHVANALDETLHAPQRPTTVRRDARADALDTQAAVGNPMLVEVRDLATQRVVAGADVWSLSTREHRADFEALLVDASRDLLAFVVERGELTTTDSGGIAILDSARGDRLVVARAGDRAGIATASAASIDSRCVLIAPVSSLHLRVHTADDRPAKVGARIVGASSPVDVSTDAQGERILAGLSTRLAWNLDERSARRPFVLSLDVVAEDRVARWIDPRDWPKEPVEMRLPACGGLVVRAMSAGEPAREAHGSVTAQKVSIRRIGRTGSFALAERPFTDGVAEFEHVTLGGEVELVLTNERGEQRKRIAAPTVPGETVEATFEVAPPRARRIKARFIDANGAALANREWSVDRFTRSSTPRFEGLEQLASVLSDADGRVVLVLAPRPEEADSTSLWICERDAAGRPATAEITFERGASDLGDVLVAPTQPLVHGVVVDVEGEPVPDEKVRLVSIVEDGETSAPFEVFGTTSDDRGEFAIHAPCPRTSFGVVAGEGYWSVHVPAKTCGEPTELRLEVYDGGAVEGSLLLDEGAHDGLAFTYATLEQPETEPRTLPMRRSGVLASGARRVLFRIEDLPVGDVAWKLVEPVSQRPLAVFEGVRIRPRRVTSDPRLVDIDLRGKLAAVSTPLERLPFDLTIVDARGDRIATGTVSGGPGTLERFLAGRARGELGSNVPWLAVRAPHKISARIEPPFTGRTVVLDDAPQLSIALELPSDLQSSELRWSVRLERLRRSSNDDAKEPFEHVHNHDGLRYVRLELDERRTAAIEFEQATDAVRTRVRVALRGSERWIDLRACDPELIEISSSASPRHVVLRIAENRLEDARELLHSRGSQR